MKYQANDKLIGTSYSMRVLNQELAGLVGGVVARFEPNTYVYSAKVYVTEAATGANTAITVKSRDGAVTYGTFDGTAVGVTTIALPNKLVSGNDLLVNLDDVVATGFDGEARLEVLFTHQGGGGCVTGNTKADEQDVFTPTAA